MKRKIVILSYHSISLSDYLYSVSPADFSSQLAYLKNNFKVISIDDLDGLLNDKSDVGNYAVITFDDGLKDNFEMAFPILKKLQLPATIFVATGLVGGEIKTAGGNLKMMHWDDMRAMQASGLVTLGCHSHTHLDLSAALPETIKHEVENSKVVMEKELGMPIKYFAYPKSRFNEQVKNIIKNHFVMAFGGNGIVADGEYDQYEIPRVVVRRNMPLWKLKLMTRPWFWQIKRILNK